MSTKKFGIVAGLVFALSIVLSPAASACSLQDLSSCDNDGLMALIVQMLAGQTTTTTTTTTETAPTVTGLPAGFQFNTNLKLGSTGNDVKYLQILLIYKLKIKNGDFSELLTNLMQKPVDEIKELYNTREIEK